MKMLKQPLRHCHVVLLGKIETLVDLVDPLGWGRHLLMGSEAQARPQKPQSALSKYYFLALDARPACRKAPRIQIPLI